MNDPVHDLLELLTLGELGGDAFGAHSEQHGRTRIFGGQVLAQALIAAGRTVPGRSAHSLHGYFLLPGDPGEALKFEVERIRDGSSFTTRRVLAKQRARPILSMSVSFQVPESGLDHQEPMPDVPGPDGLPSELDQRRAVAERIPEARRQMFTRERAFDVRPIQQADLLDPGRQPPHRDYWLRVPGRLPSDGLLHQAMLAYVSDMNLLAAGLLPHGLSFLRDPLQMASLDHALWFHRPFRVDEWLLYRTHSPSASHARAFTRAEFFTRDGRLVASVAQEGLIRTARRPSPAGPVSVG